jgi:hypothetical protein
VSKILVIYRVTAPKVASKWAVGFDLVNYDEDIEDEDCLLLTRKWKAVEDFFKETVIPHALISVKKVYDDATIEVMDLSHRMCREYIPIAELEKTGVVEHLKDLGIEDFDGNPVRRSYFHMIMKLFSLPITGKDRVDQQEFLKWFDNPYVCYIKAAP